MGKGEEETVDPGLVQVLMEPTTSAGAAVVLEVQNSIQASLLIQELVVPASYA